MKTKTATKRSDRAGERVIAKLAEGGKPAHLFTAAERAELPRLEKHGAIVYAGGLWKLASLAHFRNKIWAAMRRHFPGAIGKGGAAGFFVVKPA